MPRLSATDLLLDLGLGLLLGTVPDHVVAAAIAIAPLVAQVMMYRRGGKTATIADLGNMKITRRTLRSIVMAAVLARTQAIDRLKSLPIGTIGTTRKMDVAVPIDILTASVARTEMASAIAEGNDRGRSQQKMNLGMLAVGGDRIALRAVDARRGRS